MSRNVSWGRFTKAPRPTDAELPALSERTLRAFYARRERQGIFPPEIASPEVELVALVERRINLSPGLSPALALGQILEEALSTPDARGKWPSGRYAEAGGLTRR